MKCQAHIENQYSACACTSNNNQKCSKDKATAISTSMMLSIQSYQFLISKYHGIMEMSCYAYVWVFGDVLTKMLNSIIQQKTITSM